MNKPYKVNHDIIPLDDTEDSQLSFFDSFNPDINLFNAIDDELIRISGSKVFYYKFLQGETSYDEVYLEERNKPRLSEPIIVHVHYDPKVIEKNLSEFGIEITNDIPFIFNKSYLDTQLGRPPIPGDVILPKFQNIKYEIIEVQEDSFELYGVYHYTCSAKVLRDTAESIADDVTEITNDLGGLEEIV